MRLLSKKVIIVALLLIFAMVYYYFYNDSNISQKEKNIAFLQENKHIEKKDFISLLESFIPKLPQPQPQTPPQITESSKTDSKDSNKKLENLESNGELKLLAIINNEAFINNKWYKTNEKLTHNDKQYTIKKIKDYEVTLIESKNTSNIVLLQMFVLSDGADFKKIK